MIRILRKIFGDYTFDFGFSENDVPEPAVTTDSYITILRER